jgi:hypothetical protein
MNRIKSIESHLSFVELSSGKQLSQIWELLENGLWKTVNVQAYEENTKTGELKRENWKPVLENIFPLYSGMEWERKQGN